MQKGCLFCDVRSALIDSRIHHRQDIALQNHKKHNSHSLEVFNVNMLIIILHLKIIMPNPIYPHAQTPRFILLTKLNLIQLLEDCRLEMEHAHSWFDEFELHIFAAFPLFEFGIPIESAMSSERSTINYSL